LVLGFIILEAVIIQYVDRPLALFTHDLDTTQHDLIDFFRTITDFGKSAWYLWPCGITVIFGGFLSRAKDASARTRRLAAYLGVRAFFLFGTIAASGISAEILKPLIGRARPKEFLEHHLYGLHPLTREGFAWNGMPSGHATTAFTLAFALSVLYPRLRPLWLGYATLLAISRVMVDAHYLSDICAGAVLGYAVVKIFIKYGMIHAWRVIFPIDMRKNAP
jgi:undecaprenyl-diphosphatase